MEDNFERRGLDKVVFSGGCQARGSILVCLSAIGGDGEGTCLDAHAIMPCDESGRREGKLDEVQSRERTLN
jgi:hypothetical protein